MLIGLIAICEVAFWLFVAGGLAVRYLLRPWRPSRRLSTVLLVCAPMMDIVLLVASALDLRAGGQATRVHALAAVYLGVSVGFGHRLIAWADARFAHRFDHRPLPVRPRRGPGAVRFEVAALLRHAVAWAVGSGLMLLAARVVDAPERTALLAHVPLVWAAILGVDAVITGVDVVRALVSPQRPTDSERERQPVR